jgi:hypothetical protein
MFQTFRSRAVSALAGGALLVTLVAGAAPASAAPPHVVSIATARGLAVGTTVTVEGTVTVASGTFASSFFDEGFAIQDLTGGIYISTADNLGLHQRDRARVTGVVQNFSGLLVLVPASDSGVVAHGRGLPVLTTPVRTGQVGPANQGKIVTILGRVTAAVEPDPPFGSKLSVDDGSGPIRVFLNSSTNIDPTDFAAGDLVLVTGFSSAFETPELDPRAASDLLILAHHP